MHIGGFPLPRSGEKNCIIKRHNSCYSKLVVVQVLSGVHKKTISQHNVSTSQSSSGAM